MKNKNITIFTLFICILFSFILCSCNFPSQVKEYSKSGLYFDTVISITLYTDDSAKAEDLLNESFNLCEKCENLFSAAVPESDISRINSGRGKTIQVNEDTAFLLKKSLEYSALSDGLFDITVYPLTSLWDFHGDNNVVPDTTLLNESKNHVNYNFLHVSDENTVYLDDEYSQIEVGGLAKGYIADCIANYLSSQNVSGALINMGGDIKVIGCPCGKKSFTIGINDPSNSGKPLLPIYITDSSVATSGTYERCFTIGDKLYHHILNPHSGHPCETDLKQATVITNDSVSADALATICILKGSKDAATFIDNLPETEAILITDSDEIIYSKGLNKYLSMPE